jgi:hexokinase
MADLPKDLLDEIKKLEAIFTVPTDRLKKITDQFVSELTRGKLTIHKHVQS